ncbi:MAG: enoyl-CoA hydratase [Pseudomonadota bacterium]
MITANNVFAAVLSVAISSVLYAATIIPASPAMFA